MTRYVHKVRSYRRYAVSVVRGRNSSFWTAPKDTPFFSLGLTLMLGFIPRFFEMWDDANLACDSRSCKRGLRRLYLLLPLVTERMMEASANTALALEARGWGVTKEK